MSPIPELPHHCNSWIVTRKSDSQVIGEFYERSSVERFNPDKVRIETAVTYLASLGMARTGERG